ncbi:MAG TPA: C25 family cysteine peptidase, partial [Panacibacter sp.]|nr:C25 family cysteine peptidase [Panacibacter sp.]
IKDTLQFLLQPSVETYHLVLTRGDGSVAKMISSLEQRQFIDFSNTGNQGNYLIISNPLLYGNGANDYVQEYSNYRSSDSGGHFNAKIIDIHELEDQFAFGIAMHPLSVKNFLRYARTIFTEPPADVFLIGKGVSYSAYRATNSTNPLTTKINLVPVYGSPGSDNLLSSADYDPVPATPIGRLSAVSPEEVGVYLEKIKQYESAQHKKSQILDDKVWMKKVIQLAGANDLSVAVTIDRAQARYKKIISDTLFGGDVKTYSKTINPDAYPQILQNFTDEYNKGSGLLEYFGHSSSTGIDFNLDNPSVYGNAGKYPVFIVNGCLAGNIFDYEINRLNNRSTFSEKFVLEPQRGAIGYLSASSYGVVPYLDIFTEQFYKSIAVNQYGKGFGQVTLDAINNALNTSGDIDFYKKMHAEQYTFHGDPALTVNTFSLPDYIIDSTQIIITPDYLTVAGDSFMVRTLIHNLGRAVNDSIHFSLQRKFPDGSMVEVYSNKLPAIRSIDSVTVYLPIVSNRDKGITVITATIDDDLQLPELS